MIIQSTIGKVAPIPKSRFFLVVGASERQKSGENERFLPEWWSYFATDWVKYGARFNVGSPLPSFEVQLIQWKHLLTSHPSSPFRLWRLDGKRCFCSFSSKLVVKCDIRRLGPWMVTSNGLFFCTSVPSTIAPLTTIPKDQFFFLLPAFSAHFRVIFPWIGSGDCDWLNQERCPYQCLLFSGILSSTINPMTAPQKDLSVMVISAVQIRWKRHFRPWALGATTSKDWDTEWFCI